MKKRFEFPGITLFLSILILTLGGMETLLSNTDSKVFPEALKCTSLLIGKNATVDGSVICTQSADALNCEIRLRRIPAASYQSGEKRVLQCWNVYDRINHEKVSLVRSGPTIEIPQVPHTYAYVDTTFPFMNEHQLAIAEATLGGVRMELTPSIKSDAKLRITDLSRIALERATTAREAIRIMASLLEEHGFNSWLPGVGEYFAVADKEEVWAFEFVPVGPDWKKNSGEPGVAWCAMRIPDDMFAVMANESIIGEVDLSDKIYFMASSNVKSLAIKHGWWDPDSGEPFRWDLAYTGKKAKSLRTWRALSLVAPSRNLKPYEEGYPNPIKPDKKLSILDVRRIHGDLFEGTEFDLAKGLAAGPFGNPNWPRGTPGGKRSLSVLRTTTIILNQCRDWLPDPIGGVMWVGMSAPATCVYVPFYAGITRLPQAYTTGVPHKYDRESAFWTFHHLSKWTQLDYLHMIKEIKRVQNEIESAELNRQQAIDEESFSLYQKDPILAKKFLTNYCIKNAENVLETWRELSDLLVANYGTGSINPPKVPEWWRKALIEKEK